MHVKSFRFGFSGFWAVEIRVRELFGPNSFDLHSEVYFFPKLTLKIQAFFGADSLVVTWVKWMSGQ